MAEILVVDDDPQILRSMKRVLGSEHEVSTAGTGEDCLKAVSEKTPDCILLDLNLPGIGGMDVLQSLAQNDHEMPVIVLTGMKDLKTAVGAMKAGAFDYLTKPYDIEDLRLSVRRAVDTRGLKREVSRLRAEVGRFYGIKNIVGTHPLMQELFEKVHMVAPRRSTVLIAGESGTGKELVARAIHQLSPVQDKLFVPVNCAAIPEGLMEDEFFGHERGAFTDARTARVGQIERANGGTLFLDEISELSPSGQAKLLRVLQEKEFTRVGGQRPVKVDIRLIAATNKDLRELTEQDRFRQDLFYRVHVVPLQLPPLRERRSDIPLLLAHFLKRIAEREAIPPKKITAEAMETVTGYNWPGNVRELENVAEQMMALTRGEEIQLEHIPFSAANGASLAWPAQEAVLEGKVSLTEAVRRFEQDTIDKALKQAGGNKTKAASLLRITRRMLRYKLKDSEEQNDNGD